jgi:sodium/bile acid cotransporter 7
VGVWAGRGTALVVATLVGCLVLFWLLFLVTNALGRACASIEDRITAVFCGSKKTLASGVPMAQLIFAGHPGLSFILLPILIYHPMQLLICGWLRRAGRGGRSRLRSKRAGGCGARREPVRRAAGRIRPWCRAACRASRRRS